MIQRYFTIFYDILRYFRIFHDISRYFTIFHDIYIYFSPGSYALHTPLVKDGTSHVVHQKSRDMRIRESRDHQMVDNILDVIDANNPNNSLQRYLQQQQQQQQQQQLRWVEG